jgi:uncharacterized membrane protein YhaH (DUF805 family)
MTSESVDSYLNHAIPRVSTAWSWRDFVGACAVRWSARRNNYTIQPGLYTINEPTADAPVLVTANYKLSFDHLRRVLEGISAWILVLDTKGINVWCAAGKGTFGTEELVNRLQETQMAQRVTHRIIIVPQLGAPGVAAHDIQQRTGFKVVYGPVYARDLPAFLSAGLQAEPQMRRIGFSLRERLAVVPVELVQRFPQALVLLLVLMASAALGQNRYQDIIDQGPWIALAVGSNFVTGLVLIPALLPYLPGRAFALKGLVAGLLLGLVLVWFWPFGSLSALSVGLLSIASCSFLSLMFTGCTPYTSASGVRCEMRWALPLQGILTVLGLTGWGVSRFI